MRKKKMRLTTLYMCHTHTHTHISSSAPHTQMIQNILFDVTIRVQEMEASEKMERHLQTVNSDLCQSGL